MIQASSLASQQVEACLTFDSASELEIQAPVSKRALLCI